VVEHEDFVEALYEQDIALLQLAQDMVYSASLLPVCLPGPSGRGHEGELGTLTGWGRHWDEGPLASQLEVVQLPILSNRQCMDWYNR
jgi:hypothetical protein